MTVEQDVIFPFIPNDKVEEMRKEPIFQKYQIDAGNLTRGLVSCTGAQVGNAARFLPGLCGGPLLVSVCLEDLDGQTASPHKERAAFACQVAMFFMSLSADWVLQYCGLAVIETKNRAMAMVEKLEQQLDMPKKVRIHWTGCPNSCGQVSHLPCNLQASCC